MKLRWPHGLAAVALAIGAVAAGVFCVFEFGIAQRWARNSLVRQLEERTGARVELGGFHLHAWRLHAELDDLTLHGLESSSEPPLFHADRVQVGITVLSFLHREFKIDELLVDRPQLNVRYEKDGHSNVPAPKMQREPGPWQDTLFNLRIGKVELRNGGANINDRKVPLEIRGQNLAFLLQYVMPAEGNGAYVGNLSWNQVELDLQKDVPLRFDLSTKFVLNRDSFQLDELVWKTLHSELNLRAERPSFGRAEWDLRYRGRLSLEDVRKIFREPLTPDLIADFSGEARYASGDWTGSGHFDGHDVKMPYEWFHATNIETSGNYTIAKKKLVVENLAIRALEGSLDGRLEMDLPTLAFRTQTHFHHASLAEAIHAVNNTGFPIDTLHWDGGIDVDSYNTWTANFKHFTSKGESRWSPPAVLTPGMIPVTARILYDYREDSEMCALSDSEITTPNTQLEFNGALSGLDTTLELKLEAQNLVEWDDFINRLRGVNAVPTRIAGSVKFRGRILGPIAGPTFSGHIRAADARYDGYQWDEIYGDLDYSLDDFKLSKAVVRRGQASFNLDLSMQLDGDWSFVPQSVWSLAVQTAHAPSDDVQAMLGTSYPFTAAISATLNGSGTNAAPVLNGNFTLENIQTKGLHFDRLGGALHFARDEVRLSHAELGRDAGRVTGDILYRPQEENIEFDLTGAGIQLDKIQALQNTSLPLAGRLDFALRGGGPVRAPAGKGDFHVLNLKIGADEEGDFHGQLDSDGHNVRVALDSQGSHGQLKGELSVGLSGDEDISGKLSVVQFDLDPLFTAGLHLKNLTGHSVVDGNFTLAGALRKPDSIEVNADISQISLNYLFISLQNDGPVRFTYHRNEIRIAQAHLHGPDTDFQISGSARFDRERPVHVSVTGAVNLGLLKGLMPDLHAAGEANVNVAIEGTMSKPRITGRTSVRDASANYSDFPVGLSHLTGDLVFDRSRLLFENVTADSGGGQLTLNGSVTYGEEGPVRYEIYARTPQVRIRYPAGMSWLTGGTLQLVGTTERAVLSGNVELKRLLFAPGADITSFFGASPDTSAAGEASSAFMRNLTFDVAAHTSPGARVEWTGAQVEIDSDLHLRGTWDRPDLARAHSLLGGEMSFRGNNFTLTRGDMNFANPFQLDPELNIEATSTISQYLVTINFSGRASKLSLAIVRTLRCRTRTSLLSWLWAALGRRARCAPNPRLANYGATALLSEAISSGLGGRIEHFSASVISVWIRFLPARLRNRTLPRALLSSSRSRATYCHILLQPPPQTSNSSFRWNTP